MFIGDRICGFFNVRDESGMFFCDHGRVGSLFVIVQVPLIYELHPYNRKDEREMAGIMRVITRWVYIPVELSVSRGVRSFLCS